MKLEQLYTLNNLMQKPMIVIFKMDTVNLKIVTQIQYRISLSISKFSLFVHIFNGNKVKKYVKFALQFQLSCKCSVSDTEFYSVQTFHILTGL